MALPANLNTNEVKDRSGTEKEFLFRDEIGRSREYMLNGEAPYLPERVKIQHRDVGKAGFTQRRQSNLSIIKTIISPVDNVTPIVIRASVTLDVPQGALTGLNEVKDVAAYMNSLLSTTGAGTTVLFDGTGTATAALVNGTL